MKRRKGFTLIELLAVIVILGLLMAIAIPSVTKYITQSRKKTVISSIENYISALITQVNDMEYVFTGTNKIYAVPIECIALERGGTNPFGEWMQANSKYWAYVLVQYDDKSSSYTYGFTFKDSAGYGLYPITSEKLDEDGSQIQQDLNLKVPVSGSYKNITEKDNWNGFGIDEETVIIVLKASNEGENGDGINTCTLCQKGSNYESIKSEIADRTLMPTNRDGAFWTYRDSIKTITFENSINIPDDAVDSWDVSNKQNNQVMAHIRRNSEDANFYDLYIQADGEIYANANSSQLFREFVAVDRINNLDILNTSNVTNMASMFEKIGYESEVFTLDLGTNFNTSKVTNMSNMFFFAGGNSLNFELNLGNNFDTSKVTNMSGMFRALGYISPNFSFSLGDKFDTSNVTNMSYMFYATAQSSKNFSINLGNKFDTSKVTDMTAMFYYLGRNNENFKLDLGDKFDTSNVTNMKTMFFQTGYYSKVFTLNLGNKFNTGKVTNMDSMFSSCGIKSPSFVLDCRSWDVSSVTSHTGFNDQVASKVIAPNW